MRPAASPAFNAPDAVTGLLLIALGAITFIAAGHLSPPINRVDVGPAALPRLLALCLIVGGALLVVTAMRPSARPSHDGADAARRWLVPLAIAAAVAYALVLPRIGYFSATSVWIPPMLLSVGIRRWKEPVIVTLSFLVVAKLIFATLLGVPLP